MGDGDGNREMRSLSFCNKIDGFLLHLIFLDSENLSLLDCILFV
jgi:hypothetical protein